MFVIGANLQPNEALNALQGKYGEFDFPKTLSVENVMPMDIVDPWIGLYLDSNIKLNGVTQGEFKFPTFGHLMKFEADMEALAKMNGYARAVIIDDVVLESEHTETEQSTPTQDQADEVPLSEQSEEEEAESANAEQSDSSEQPKRTRGRQAQPKEGVE